VSSEFKGFKLLADPILSHHQMTDAKAAGSAGGKKSSLLLLLLLSSLLFLRRLEIPVAGVLNSSGLITCHPTIRNKTSRQKHDQEIYSHTKFASSFCFFFFFFFFCSLMGASTPLRRRTLSDWWSSCPPARWGNDRSCLFQELVLVMSNIKTQPKTKKQKKAKLHTRADVTTSYRKCWRKRRSKTR